MSLEVRGLCKAYGQVVVADRIEIDLSVGQCLGVIGPNGAGKSSLFHLITGTVAADAGHIALDGKTLSGLPVHQRARLGVARAFQVPQPFGNLSVFDNALAAASFSGGLRGEAAAQAASDALRRCGLEAMAHKTAGALPLLDRKRLEMAKAVASQPRLLLLDEVAGGLTEREVHLMVELVHELKQSYAVIWIEHIAQALRAVADRIMVLHFGRKLLEDTPAEVMDSAIVREIYMGVPANAAA
ncbi:ATP-binding cassette domain-containing protein [Hydrogenophaga taeniospiralis]|uniref:ABC transporter ATP-binding protein n=1 Tax=Hydrogenophaga taeniospiralis TaxID=65656 RepID=UPI001CFB002F|nr:ATP-binding cassette domain-containing protein [Hydrogenophaga taeniospiralis]MCB4364190.1 ATP-binding cassette domain-containing protein [Hydrogenophaga taeniospiralis]